MVQTLPFIRQGTSYSCTYPSLRALHGLQHSKNEQQWQHRSVQGVSPNECIEKGRKHIYSNCNSLRSRQIFLGPRTEWPKLLCAFELSKSSNVQSLHICHHQPHEQTAGQKEVQMHENVRSEALAPIRSKLRPQSWHGTLALRMLATSWPHFGMRMREDKSTTHRYSQCQTKTWQD